MISHKRISRPLNEEQDQIHHGSEQSAANTTQLLPCFRIHPKIHSSHMNTSGFLQPICWTRQNLTTVARISKQPSLIRSPPGWYRNGTAAFASNVTSFLRQFFFYKINIQTTVSQLFGGLFQPPDHHWLIRKRLLSSRGFSASVPIFAVRLCPNYCVTISYFSGKPLPQLLR